MKQVRTAIKQLPLARHAYALMRLLRGRNARFSADYAQNSGIGSTLDATRAVSCALPGLLDSLSVRSMLDIPCGDFTWMNRVDLGSVAYTGADVIESLILSHKTHHGSAQKNFAVLDLVESRLPAVDLIFVRDCLVHLSNRLVMKAVANIKLSQSRYLLTTTFPRHPTNESIVTGNWRPINLCAPPFNFPAPIRLLDEEHPAPYEDKSMGLWRVQDLPTY
jgi:hypothetical protein